MAQLMKSLRPSQPVLRLSSAALRGSTELPNGSGDLRVFVPHISAEFTRAALMAVAALTRNLGARVILLAVQIVPFPLPLDRPDVSPDFLKQKLTALAREIDAAVEVRVVMARDRELGLERAISPGSLVVFVETKRWWPTTQSRLAHMLARTGHSVAFLEV
jgi:hypothetical protein